MEINPQNNVLPEYPQSYLDPCLNISRPPYYQSVYSCSGYPVEPYQQMFPWQSGSYYGQLDSSTIYNVEIISGTEYAYFYKFGYWDTLSNVQVDPEYIGSSLTGLTGVELAGWGEYSVYQGIGVWEREHFALYNIRFDNFDLQTAYVTVRITNTSTNEVTDWHTTIVNPQYTMQNSGIDGDTVLHNKSVNITPNISNSLALTCNQFGYGSCPPTNVTFNIEIVQGQEYGNIGKYNDFFGSFEYAPAYTGLSYDEFRYGFYVFSANGLQPDSTAVVRIRQSSSDTDIGSFEYTLNIKRNFLPPVSENGSIVIETNKNTAMPGDTLDILLKWEDGSNGIVDFSDWQEFGVWLADGFSYGTLLDPVTGDTSDAFDVIGKELKLVVHQDVTDANKKIVIAAETEVAVLGGNRMIQNNPQPKTETKSTDKKIISNYRTVEQGGFVKANNKIDKSDAVDKNKDDGAMSIDIAIGSQYLSGIKEIIVNPFIVEIDPPTVSAGDTARIIPKYMDSTGNYVEFDSLQTFELGMLDGCALGKLSNAGIDTNYFYGVTQPFYFIADTSADSGSVNIRVGVIDMNPQNRSLTNNYQPQPDNPVTYCFFNQYQTKLYLDEKVLLGNECLDFKCDNNLEFISPKIKLDVVPPDYGGFDYCRLLKVGAIGATAILFDWDVSDPTKKGHLLVPFKVSELCFDNSTNNWNYSIISKNKDEFSNVYGRWDAFYLRVVSTVCIDAYSRWGSDFTLIQNFEEIGAKISVEDVCLALQDFEYNRPYASDPEFKQELHDYIQVRNNTSQFKFCEIVPADTMHEYVHFLDLGKDVNATLSQKVIELNNKRFSSLLQRVSIPCDKANRPDDAANQIKSNYDKLLKIFNQYLEKRVDDRENENELENNTQWNPLVQNLITKYQNKLIKIYPGSKFCSIFKLTRKN